MARKRQRIGQWNSVLQSTVSHLARLCSLQRKLQNSKHRRQLKFSLLRPNDRHDHSARPQTSKDVDIGANLKTEQYSAEVLYFNSKIRNEIGYDPDQGNVNYDPTKREGLNLRQRLVLTKYFATRLNLQFTNAKFTGGPNIGRDTPNVPPVFGNLSFDYSVSQKGQITATTRFSSSRLMSGDFDNSHAKTPGYTVQDLSYFHKEKNWSLAATLSNITNKKYTDTGIYHATYTAPYQSTVYPNFGRNFSLVGRYTF